MKPEQAPAPKETIRNQAISWLILLRDEQVDDRTLDEFSTWLAQDPQHSQAFAEAEQLFKDMLGVVQQPALPVSHNSAAADFKPPPRRQRRPWFRYAIGIAASWLFISRLVLPNDFNLLDQLFSDYQTATGEVRSITLADGSRLLLNTQSAVSIDFNEHQRTIKILHGEVRFEVARDQHRPFEVKAGDLKVRALGTIFDIHQNAEQTQVLVEEHAVSVKKTALDQTQEAIKIEEGQSIVYQAGQALPAALPVRLEQATAWQQRKLVVTDQPLSELLAELERYQAGRIFIADPKLREMRVSGSFSLQDPQQVLHTVCVALNLKLQSIGPWWSIVQR